ncbi:TPA: plasmid SOS inhibition protein A, partial [Escherichia coli]|nr:plasmid SOS inhibition protein A [Escherichia coli]
FPSLAGMERWQWQDMPFWQVITEAGMAAREAGHAVREMERWMVGRRREVALLTALETALSLSWRA